MKIWQKKGILAWLLLPIGLLYWFVSFVRRACYHFGIFPTYHAPIPVIIIGNISVGGTGKTPLVIALTEDLQARGYKIGIVSRGYKSRANHYPYIVTKRSPAHAVGDEALLLSRRTKVPVVIDPIRPRAIQKLLATFHCDVIISDDGLQHYAMDRDIEIVVIDAKKRLGNGWCLPAGPLREGKRRLKDVDIIVANGVAKSNEVLMRLKPGEAYQLSDPAKTSPLNHFAGQSINAIAGIGDPTRFFDMLKSFNINLREIKSLPDHHYYRGEEFNLNNEDPIFITEKDAVKCQDFSRKNIWVVPVQAMLPNSFYEAIERLLKHDFKD